MAKKLTEAHEYILDLLVQKGSRSRYWIVEIAMGRGYRVVNRTINTLTARGFVTIDEDDYLEITPAGLAAIGKAPALSSDAPAGTSVFEVGDKVQVAPGDLYTGRCGVIVDHLENGVNYRVKLDLGNNDMHRLYHADELVLWKPEGDELAALRRENAALKKQNAAYVGSQDKLQKILTGEGADMSPRPEVNLKFLLLAIRRSNIDPEEHIELKTERDALQADRLRLQQRNTTLEDALTDIESTANDGLGEWSAVHYDQLPEHLERYYFIRADAREALNAPATEEA